jgi:hypothetical protein
MEDEAKMIAPGDRLFIWRTKGAPHRLDNQTFGKSGANLRRNFKSLQTLISRCLNTRQSTHLSATRFAALREQLISPPAFTIARVSED